MVLKDQTVLVTGATGFLGGEIARRAAAQGAHVLALARRPDRDRYIKDVPGISVIMGDITDRDHTRTLMAGVDYVIHAAAALGGSLEAQSTVNIHGTYNVARAAAECGVKRLVHISTIAVYGYRVREDVTEETPCDPGADPYHITKVGAERTVVDIGYQYGLNYAIIRPGMIYGPRSVTWTRSMFRLVKRGPIWLGSGGGSAYPVHVSDVADLALLAAEHPAAQGEAFNCTPDPSPTWREFLGAYAELIDRKRWIGVPPFLLRAGAPVISMLSPAHAQAKDLKDLVPFILDHHTYRMDKAAERLGWSPQVDLKAGVQSCVPYLKEKGLM
ncbi:MAG: NAD-dependent epimerase/dehydratase family protein [Chloroflexota bacterium]